MTNVEPVIHDVDFSMTCCKLYVFLCKMIDMCHFLLGRWERREGGRGEEGGEGGREGGREESIFFSNFNFLGNHSHRHTPDTLGFILPPSHK